jgi:hypothetical protein
VALAAAAGLALHPALSADRRVWLVAALGGLAVVSLTCALVMRWTTPLAWAIVLLGAEYGAWLAERGAEVDTRAPLYAAGLLLTAELAFDGLERSVVRSESEVVARRGIQLALLAVGAVAGGTIVLAAATIPVGGSVALTLVGVAAATVALALIARLAK